MKQFLSEKPKHVPSGSSHMVGQQPPGVLMAKKGHNYAKMQQYQMIEETKKAKTGGMSQLKKKLNY